MLQLQRRVIINNAQFGTDARIMSVEPLHVYIIVDDPTLNTHTHIVELAWRCGSVMDYQATARVRGLFIELNVLRKGQ